MGWDYPKMPVDAVPLEEGELPEPEPDVQLFQAEMEAGLRKLGFPPRLAEMYAHNVTATVDKQTVKAYPCRYCKREQYFRFPLPDVKTRMDSLEKAANRIVGKPTETVKYEATVDIRKSLSDMSEEELERLARGALPG